MTAGWKSDLGSDSMKKYHDLKPKRKKMHKKENVLQQTLSGAALETPSRSQICAAVGSLGSTEDPMARHQPRGNP